MMIDATLEECEGFALLARRLGAIMLTAREDEPIMRRPHDRLHRATTVLASLDRRLVLFGDLECRDPAWTMLLELYLAYRRDSLVSVSSLCIAARVPSTTALRWQAELVRLGLCTRDPDQEDGRRVYIGLTERAVLLVEQWLDGWHD